MRRPFRLLMAVLCLLIPGISLMTAAGGDWRTADRSSTGIAPLPQEHPAALVQIYAARAFSWRGRLAVHTWIATKERDADGYEVHQVIGWRERRGLPVLASGPEIPDRSWFGSHPDVLVDIRGERAEALIPEIRAAVRTYPFADEYTLWPGPNSNTFTAHVGRQVPEMGLVLPPTAIGKDYLTNGGLLDSTPSGSGYQFSLLGILGLGLSREEGLEINLLGLSFGVHPLKLQLRLPGIGIIGKKTGPAFTGKGGGREQPGPATAAK